MAIASIDNSSGGSNPWSAYYNRGQQTFRSLYPAAIARNSYWYASGSAPGFRAIFDANGDGVGNNAFALVNTEAMNSTAAHTDFTLGNPAGGCPDFPVSADFAPYSVNGSKGWQTPIVYVLSKWNVGAGNGGFQYCTATDV